jgi:hypothetical protein
MPHFTRESLVSFVSQEIITESSMVTVTLLIIGSDAEALEIRLRHDRDKDRTTKVNTSAENTILLLPAVTLSLILFFIVYLIKYNCYLFRTQIYADLRRKLVPYI